MAVYYGALTVVLLGCSLLLVNRYAPRCPECGSRATSSLRVGMPVWFCESCQTVWRVKRRW